MDINARCAIRSPMGLFNRKKDEKKCDATEAEAPKTVSKAQPKAAPKAETKPKTEPKDETKAETVPEEAAPVKQSKGAYFVSPRPDGRWQVKRANSEKVLKTFDTKAEAEVYAKRVATNQGSTVKIGRAHV